MTSKIQCFYSCGLCGLVKVPVMITARGPEDVLAWMKAAGYELAADHHARSPRCQGKSLQNVMIPIDGAEKIGGAPVN